jgi:hypothetical protein
MGGDGKTTVDLMVGVVQLAGSVGGCSTVSIEKVIRELIETGYRAIPDARRS